MTPSPISDSCQRWSERRPSWRHADDGGFEPRRYEVAVIHESVAMAYVVKHHYSGSYPSARLRYGLFEGATLRGVAVLSVPVQKAVLTNVFPDLEPYTESLELGRFVLDQEVPANGESWFLGQLFRAAAADGLRGVVSFSDPLPRQAGDRIVMPGHVGIIYQSTNAQYLGRGRARWLRMLPDATVLNDRSVAKVVAQDQGHEYVERKLMSYGAAAPKAGQQPSAWLAEAIDAIGVRRVKHQGNHRFAFALGGPSQRRSLRIVGDRSSYPKQVDSAA